MKINLKLSLIIGLFIFNQAEASIECVTYEASGKCLKYEIDREPIRFSDTNLKTNVLTIPNSLERLTNLNGVSYNYEIPINNENNLLIQSLPQANQEECSTIFKKLAQIQNEQLGVIAQDVQEVFPELVTNKCGYLQVDYVSLIPVMIEAIKELKQQINDLKNESQI
ncbi:tail fiber domain-containing protein [Zooshikella harenae]|uniref:Tail fiber domain-containing protein n=1 Tax=Zooshikella harenae TaxID=2827238 RepID=A0ABS5ZL35_9GAMM|nr:tail fiber domain-containing protein [Zooshikella harenae]MBU2714061.1 tail fiber domain-containing protein [Zooshikella harenae]